MQLFGVGLPRLLLGFAWSFVGLKLVAAHPLDFHGRCRVVRTRFIAGALHGVEASSLSHGSLLKLRSAIVAAVWSRGQPLAHGSTVLSLLAGA